MSRADRRARREAERTAARPAKKRQRAARREADAYAAAAAARAAGRTCGTCVACCVVESVPLGRLPEAADLPTGVKPRGAPCPALATGEPGAGTCTGAGCAAYARRPEPCRTYLCAYREGLVSAPPAGPEGSGLLVHRGTDPAGRAHLVLQELTPDAVHAPAGREAVREAGEALAGVPDAYLLVVPFGAAYGRPALPWPGLARLAPAGLPAAVPVLRFPRVPPLPPPVAPPPEPEPGLDPRVEAPARAWLPAFAAWVGGLGGWGLGLGAPRGRAGAWEGRRKRGRR